MRREVKGLDRTVGWRGEDMSPTRGPLGSSASEGAGHLPPSLCSGGMALTGTYLWCRGWGVEAGIIPEVASCSNQHYPSPCQVLAGSVEDPAIPTRQGQQDYYWP